MESQLTNLERKIDDLLASVDQQTRQSGETSSTSLHANEPSDKGPDPKGLNQE